MRITLRSRHPLPVHAALASLLVCLASASCKSQNGANEPSPDSGPVADMPDSGTSPQGASVTFRVTVPADTPADSDVFIAGDFQGWNPGDPRHQLSREADQRYAITLSFEPGTSIEFKFTRGSWELVEKGPKGEEIANRALTITESGTQELTVASWASGTPAPSTITGNVTTITVPGFLDERRVWVYLPPGYDKAAKTRYPVLYMLDGQNLFDQATSFAGEWQIDETCEALIPAGEIRPIIVVGIDNGGQSRIGEYTPWPDAKRAIGGSGDAHLQEIVAELIPYINQNYRTLTDRNSTALAGSSLGGLISLYAAYEHDEVFGRIAALSPSLWWDNNHLAMHIDAQERPASRIYTDMGTLESGQTQDEDRNGVDDSIDDLRALRSILVEQGFAEGVDLTVVEADKHRHNEAYWAMRFPEALRFLFPPTQPIRRHQP